jgi:FKBP-type peptidyl-prolyl cis-trans isomerase
MIMRKIASVLGFGLAGAMLVAGPAGAVTASDAPASAPTPDHHAAAASHGTIASQTAALHALGVLISRQLGSFQLTDSELRAVLAGVADGVHHPDSLQQAQTYIPQLQALQGQRTQAQSQREARIGAAYQSKAAALPNAHKTASGMIFISEQEGTGPNPKLGDQVRVQYTGKLTNGTVFDSSDKHGGSAVFPIGRIIPCWNEALQLMKVGGSAHIVCPATLAYGDRGAGDLIKPGSTLDFEVHLLAILPPAPPAAAPGAGAPKPVPPAPTH